MKKLISLSFFALSTVFACQGSPVTETVPSASASASAAAPESSSSVPSQDAGIVDADAATRNKCFTDAGVRRIPDVNLTPGKICSSVDIDFDGYRYPSKIAYCRRHVTQKMKNTVAKAYGIDKADYHLYEFDHYIPLAAGGANDVANLWPQPLSDAKSKDDIENKIYQGLKSGTMTQEIAVAIVNAWQPDDCK